jgi:ABC-2 type transport system ATP-binding protein
VLKAEIGRPSVEAIPAEREDLPRTREVLARFGESVTASPKGAAVRLSGGDAQLADVVRALDAEDIHVQHLQLHAPTLDDVFLSKTGRSLEGQTEEAAEEEEEPEPEAVAA